MWHRRLYTLLLINVLWQFALQQIVTNTNFINGSDIGNGRMSDSDT